MKTKITNQPEWDRVMKARVSIMLDDPFFGSLLGRMRYQEDTTVKTFCTDGVTIKWNPEFSKTLTPEEVRGVLIHELWHVALLHPWRRDARDLKRWNVATDYVINNKMEQYAEQNTRKGMSARFKLPSGALLDNKYSGMCEEEVYGKLPKQEDNNNQGGGQGDTPGGGGFGDVTDAPGSNSEQQESLERAKLDIQQAIIGAKQQGKLPADMERELQDAQAPKVNWKEQLRHFLTSTLKDDYSYKKPRSAWLSDDLVLPSLCGEGCGRVAVAIDTSGSVNEDMLSAFMAEVNDIMEEVKPECVEVIACDASVQWSKVFMRGEQLEVKLHGGGGTDHAPVFEHIDEQNEWPVCVVCLTDMATSFPDKAPGYPVLWAATEECDEPPFGVVVPMWK